MKRILAPLLLCAAIIGAPALAQTSAIDNPDLATLKKAAQTDKRALVASTLKLTDAEAKKFWPVYDAYQRDLVSLTRERNRALEGMAMRDRPMSDAYAKQLANDLTSVEESEAKARRKANNAVMRALPPKKAAMYMMLEWKLRILQSYEIAAAFPLTM